MLAMGMLLAASTCYADAKVEVKGVESDYLQKYVMNAFHEQYPGYTFASRTANKAVYFENSVLADKKKNLVLGSKKHEITFTTEQVGEDVVLGIQQLETDSYRSGKIETIKCGNDLDDLLYLNEYRAFFNDTYNFCFVPSAKDHKEGVRIESVYGFGPMFQAGIQKGDIIVAVNGVPVAGKAKEVMGGLIPDKFSSAPVVFTIIHKDVTKDYTLTPVLRESKYTKIKQARAKAIQDKKEGRRGIESWLKL